MIKTRAETRVARRRLALVGRSVVFTSNSKAGVVFRFRSRGALSVSVRAFRRSVGTGGFWRSRR